MLVGLGYVGINTRSLDDWQTYGSGFLGMQVTDRSRKSLALRMDDRRQRLVVSENDGTQTGFFGWEVENATQLDAVAQRLQAHGVPFVQGSRALAEQRRVADLIAFEDPVGTKLEVFHGAEITTAAFVPGRSISGFRTGPLGLGHVVLTVVRIEDVFDFYTQILGFNLSDYALKPFRAYFFHVGPRHHSLAFIETGKVGVHHLMVELFNLDDVGQAYDLAQGMTNNVGATLGRHTNDLMTSFYSWTPSEFMVEYGWGGRDIDPNTWTPFEMKYGPSLWGHDRTWLDDERRALAREMRLDAARHGLRQPVQVLEGNYSKMSGVCPWWDATIIGRSAD